MVRKRKDELKAELGDDLVDWADAISAFYDDLPPDDGKPKPDDVPTLPAPAEDKPAAPPPTPGGWERTVRGRGGEIMPCIICGQEKTLDGRYCKRHSQ